LLLSFVAHATAFGLWKVSRVSLASTVAAGPRSGDPVAAAGGGALRAIQFRPPPEIVVPPPPAKLVPHVRPQVQSPPPLILRPASLSAALPAPGAPGRGMEHGAGRGDGGSEASGKYRLIAPRPRSIIPEWDPPKEVRGTQVLVRVLIDRWGRPTGAVELHPETPNRRFNRRLVDKVLRMDYEPARRHGRPISAWAEMTFLF